MRFFLSRRLPFGFRAGISVPLNGGGRSSARRGADRPDTGDFVYVVRNENNGTVKIGVSGDPVENLRALQRGSADPLELSYTVAVQGDAYRVERGAHNILDRYRQKGEWFSTPVDAAVATIHTAAYQAGESVVSVAPHMVSEVVALARATGGKDGPRRRVGIKTKAFLVIAAAAVLLAWFEVYTSSPGQENLQIYATMNLITGLIVFGIISIISRVAGYN